LAAYKVVTYSSSGHEMSRRSSAAIGPSRRGALRPVLDQSVDRVWIAHSA